MSRRDFPNRLRWVALNGALFLGMGAVAYSLEGSRAGLRWVLVFAAGAAYVLIRRPSRLHP